MRMHRRPRARLHRTSRARLHRIATARLHGISEGRLHGVSEARLHGKSAAADLSILVSVAVALSLGACSPAVTPAPSPSPAEIAPVAAATLPRVTARLITHPVGGLEECHLCHGEGRVEPLPADHAGYEDETCLACHDVQLAATPQVAGSAAEQGRALWQGRSGLACRNCHGSSGEGGYGPALAGTGLDFESFRERTRAPLSDRMPPIGAGLDDPAFETSGIWISDEDLGLVYAWLAGH